MVYVYVQGNALCEPTFEKNLIIVLPNHFYKEFLLSQTFCGEMVCLVQTAEKLFLSHLVRGYD